jgi:hypothetical protein
MRAVSREHPYENVSGESETAFRERLKRQGTSKV